MEGYDILNQFLLIQKLLHFVHKYVKDDYEKKGTRSLSLLFTQLLFLFVSIFCSWIEFLLTRIFYPLDRTHSFLVFDV